MYTKLYRDLDNTFIFLQRVTSSLTYRVSQKKVAMFKDYKSLKNFFWI